MKRPILAACVAVSLLMIETLAAQECALDQLLLDSQAAVNAFAEDYGSCVELSGDLTISGPDVADLSPLSGLSSLDGSLALIDNPLLSDCSALISMLDLVDHSSPGPRAHPVIGIAPPDVSGDILIGSNAEGCNSREEISPLPLVEKTMTGSWYDPASDGEGFMIHAASENQNPVVGVSPGYLGLRIGYFYGYYPDGRRFWLIGVHTGPSDWSEPVEFVATEALNGRFEGFDTNEVDLLEWGSFTVEMHSCELATVTLQGRFEGSDEDVEKTLPVQRLGHVAGDFCDQQVPDDDTDSITGTWYDTAMSGQGFSIHKLSDNWGIVYFYGFDEAQQPLWLIGVWNDPLLMGEPVEVPLDEVTGGTWAVVNPDDITTEHWGTMKLTMNECYRATAELEGKDGYQAFDLTQLAGTIHISCPWDNSGDSGE